MGWNGGLLIIYLLSYSGVSNKRACSINENMVIFQPARPFLQHKNEQGGHCYLVPCSFIRETRVDISSIFFIDLTLSKEEMFNCMEFGQSNIYVCFRGVDGLKGQRICLPSY